MPQGKRERKEEDYYTRRQRGEGIKAAKHPITPDTSVLKKNAHLNHAALYVKTRPI